MVEPIVIEILLGCLKSRGFDLESTHMAAPDRMDKLMGLRHSPGA